MLLWPAGTSALLAAPSLAKELFFAACSLSSSSRLTGASPVVTKFKGLERYKRILGPRLRADIASILQQSLGQK